MTVSNASGTVQVAGGTVTPFAGASVTFTASTDTTLFSYLGEGWVSDAPITINIPGIITATAAVPPGGTSGLAGGTWDTTTGYIEFELGKKVHAIVTPQGVYAWDPALIGYNFQHALGPLTLPAVTVGTLAPTGSALVVTSTDGTIISVAASSAGVLTITLPAAAPSSIPTLSSAGIIIAACSIGVAAFCARRRIHAWQRRNAA